MFLNVERGSYWKPKDFYSVYIFFPVGVFCDALFQEVSLFSIQVMNVYIFGSNSQPNCQCKVFKVFTKYKQSSYGVTMVKLSTKARRLMTLFSLSSRYILFLLYWVTLSLVLLSSVWIMVFKTKNASIGLKGLPHGSPSSCLKCDQLLSGVK